MTTFDDREKSAEKKFALDEERLFKAHARRDKQFGLWAAERMGLKGAAAETYAKGLVSEDILHPGDKGILGRVIKDFAAQNIATSEADLNRKLDELFAAAKQQVGKET